MPRTKVKLEFIENSKARKSTFLKRKESLKKKIREMCILCDVEACAILFSPDEQLELWPDDMDAFRNVLDEFLHKTTLVKNKNMLNQESYLKERINKSKEQLNKQKMVNRELVKANMMSDCLSGKVSVADLNSTDLKELVSYTRFKISEIDEELLTKGDAPTAQGPPQSEQPHPQEVVGAINSSNNMAVEGTDIGPYVTVMVNTKALDEVENTDWYPPDWFTDKGADGLGVVPRLDMMKSFPKDPNSSWSDTCFPKKG
ncbi:agamous-like MADS-box protein AGL80 [Bidens hawaiensis]|uniref:agamous-like MADS-box protein AGL80 n=1 Tax=Bidens hawaiensis TaxID=980011 RepID=UPI00404B1757